MSVDMGQCYAVAFAARVGLMLYGLWQDTYMAVKFTDVDYYVFSDAADFASQVIFGELCVLNHYLNM